MPGGVGVDRHFRVQFLELVHAGHRNVVVLLPEMQHGRRQRPQVFHAEDAPAVIADRRGETRYAGRGAPGEGAPHAEAGDADLASGGRRGNGRGDVLHRGFANELARQLHSARDPGLIVTEFDARLDAIEDRRRDREIAFGRDWSVTERMWWFTPKIS